MSKTILVVDDEESVLNLIGEILESRNYQVLKARVSDEAFLQSQQFQGDIHLLLTDVKMDPFMSGSELAQCMRVLRPGIGVVYLSGFPQNDSVQNEVETSAAKFLGKPFEPKELLQMVESMVGDN